MKECGKFNLKAKFIRFKSNIVLILENKLQICLKGLCIIISVNKPLTITLMGDLADQEQAGSVTMYLSPLRRPVGKCDMSETC